MTPPPLGAGRVKLCSLVYVSVIVNKDFGNLPEMTSIISVTCSLTTGKIYWHFNRPDPSGNLSPQHVYDNSVK